jgi:superfamily I DNA/RNA helicase
VAFKVGRAELNSAQEPEREPEREPEAALVTCPVCKQQTSDATTGHAPDCNVLRAASGERVWTTEQEAVLDHFARSDRSAVVVARAGVGKTTVALEGVRRAPERSVLLTSFSKSAVETLKPRAPHWAQAKSLHGVGLQIIGRRWRGVDVDKGNGRAHALAVAACPAGTPKGIVRLVENLHTRLREICPRAIQEEAEATALDNDIVPGTEEKTPLPDVARWALRALELAREKTDKVDFADMIYLPIAMGWLAPQFDLVVQDELQDASPPQLEIARGVCGGRFVGIGDDRQAIYGWRGADTGSLARLEAELSATRLLMPETFRCGRAIVAEARLIVPDFVAHPSVCDGVVRSASREQAWLEADPGDGPGRGDFILSRTNAPLVGVVLQLFKQDKKCRILGRDVAAGLTGFVNRLSRKLDDRTDAWVLVDAAWDYHAREEARAKETKVKAAKRRAARVRDQAEMLEALADGISTIGDLRKRIEMVFSDDGSGRGVVCSNVHQIKGREARRVYALSDTFGRAVSCLCGHFASRHRWSMFHREAAEAAGFKQGCSSCECQVYRRNTDAALEEENIRYVAITRTKEVLTWVTT